MLETIKGGENTKSNMQKKLTLLAFALFLTLLTLGAVSAANSSNTEDNSANQVASTNLINSTYNSSKNNTQMQAAPDPRIEHNGVIDWSPAGYYTTIQAAIDAAQPGDTIWLERDQTFTTTNNYAHPALVYVTKNLNFGVIDPVTHLPGGTATIDGSYLFRVIYVNPDVTATFNNIIIIKGQSLNPLLLRGGGIYNDGGTVNLINCEVASCVNRLGGGIYNNGGTVSIRNSDVSGNSALGLATSGGGGIYNNGGTVNIEDSVVEGNSASGTASAGGAIYSNGGTVTIENSDVIGNSVSGGASAGGAIFFNGGTVNIRNSDVIGNSASGLLINNGGAIYNANANLYIYGNNLLNNIADEGGAVYAASGTTNIINYNRIYGNSNRELYYDGSSSAMDARYNWWESNTGPASNRYRNAVVSPYLRLTMNPVGPTNLLNQGTYLVTAELFRDSAGGDHSGAAYHVPDGPITFSRAPSWGTLTNVDTVMTNAQAHATFNANGGATPGSPITVSATVDGVTANTIFNIFPLANVIITKISVSPVNVGDVASFTITVTNDASSPDSATNVRVVDNIGLLPSWFTAGTPSQGVYDGLTWIVGILAPGRSATLVISGIAPNTAAGNTYSNSASETHNEYPFNAGPVSASIHVNRALVTITKVSVSPVNVGDVASFTITVTNDASSPDSATNVRVVDNIGLLPSWFTAGTPSQGVYDGLTWIVGILAPGRSATLVISGIAPNTAAGNTYSNSASETHNEYPFNAGPVTATIYIKKAIVKLTKSDNTVNHKANVGDIVTFSITAKNNGPDNANNVVMIDKVPQGLNVVLASIINGTYNELTRTIIWDPVTLQTGASVTKTFKATVNSEMAGVNPGLVNAASETHTEYPGTTSTTDTPIYVPKADLYVNTWTSKNNPYVGEFITITFKVGNRGPDNAEQTTFTLKIPEGMEYVSMRWDQGNAVYNPATKTLTWKLGNVIVGDPYLWLNARVLNAETSIFRPALTTITYDPNIEDNIQGLTVNAQKVPNNSSSKTVAMQKTGIPLMAILIAVIMVLGGFLLPKRE